jgi:hypothetical protein
MLSNPNTLYVIPVNSIGPIFTSFIWVGTLTDPGFPLTETESGETFIPINEKSPWSIIGSKSIG